jgi:hypothetical protein
MADDSRSHLLIRLKQGEPVRIGDAEVRIVAPDGHEGHRISILAPRSVRITRPRKHDPR